MKLFIIVLLAITCTYLIVDYYIAGQELLALAEGY